MAVPVSHGLLEFSEREISSPKRTNPPVARWKLGNVLYTNSRDPKASRKILSSSLKTERKWSGAECEAKKQLFQGKSLTLPISVNMNLDSSFDQPIQRDQGGL